MYLHAKTNLNKSDNTYKLRAIFQLQVSHLTNACFLVKKNSHLKYIFQWLTIFLHKIIDPFRS